MIRMLYDAVLPQSLSHEAPTSVELERWDGADVSDTRLIRIAAEKGSRAVILLGRDSIEQSNLRKIAETEGVTLVAVATDNPVQAKQWILKNLTTLRRSLTEHTEHDCLLVLSTEVRPSELHR